MPSGSLAEGRRAIRLAHLDNGDVLAIGGALGNSSAQVERYDVMTGQWQTLAPMSVARDSHAVVAMPDGSVLVTGGRTLQAGQGTVLATVERFDPVAGTWQAMAPMATARMNHTATLLDNGEVLVAGGFSSATNSALVSAEIYDPAANAWRSAAALPEARMNHAEVTLATGEVMLVGGNAAPFGAGVRVGFRYDAALDAWTPSAPSAMSRRNTSVELLTDGQVAVIAGGSASELAVANSAEIYDPAADAWTSTPTMLERRFNHETVVLQSGNVLVIGGQRPKPGLSYLTAVEAMVGVLPDAIFGSDFEEPAGN